MEGPEGSENLRDEAEPQERLPGEPAGRRGARGALGSIEQPASDEAPADKPGAPEDGAEARSDGTGAGATPLTPTDRATAQEADPALVADRTADPPGVGAGLRSGAVWPPRPAPRRSLEGDESDSRETEERPLATRDARDADGWPLADAVGGARSAAAGAVDAGDAADEPDAAGAPPWAQPDDAGLPRDCRFLRLVGADGRLVGPGVYAMSDHRCAAFGEPLALSTRQQQLVCLAPVHVNCPRYLRGTLLAAEPGPEPERERRHIPASIAASVLLLVASIAVSFVAVASGMVRLPGEGPGLASASLAADVTTPTPSVALSPSLATSSQVASPTVTGTATPAATPTTTPKASPSPSPSPTATPVATPTAPPTATPHPSQTWPPGATASRMQLVTPCTDGSGCWVYVIGHKDKFYEITFFFGVNANSVLRLNPWLTNTANLEPYVGRRLVIPPPTK